MQKPHSAKHSEALQFLEQLSVVRQLSPHTVKAYEQDLIKLIKFADEQELVLSEVTPVQVRAWAAKMHASGLSARSLARIISAWRSFYDWLIIDSGLINPSQMLANPLSDVRPPKRAKNLPKALSVEQVMVLVERAKLEAKTEESESVNSSIGQRLFQRDWALVELLYSSGLRLSEVLGIDLQQKISGSMTSLGWLDWDAAEVNVMGKGGKRRIVPVGAAAMTALTAWKSTLIKNNHPLDEALFVNEKSARLVARTVQLRLKSLAIRAGLPVHVHPHMLRHSFASHVLQSSHDLRAVQEMLGHASIASTQIYTALDFQHLAQAYDLAHPRAKSIK